MPGLPEFWIPYVVSNLVALGLIIICYQRPRAGRYMFGIIFVSAALINGYLGLTDPSDYLDYQHYALSAAYRSFITGFFAAHASLIVPLIAAGQLFIGVGFFLDARLFPWSVAGALLFLLSIAPLGVGSALPSTLLMAVAVVILWRRRNVKREIINV